jgi:hypothetical protein
VPRRWPHLLALLALLLISTKGAAQERCPVILHRTPPAQRDSLLRTLEAEEVVITGFVHDEMTGTPVPAMTVFLDGTRQGTMTAEDGSYLIRRVSRAEGLSNPRMIKACALGWEYLTEVREVVLEDPNEGLIVTGADGRSAPRPGYAVRLDFRVRRRPSVF